MKKATITTVTKPSRVNRRNVYAQAHSKRGGAGAGAHKSKKAYSRKSKHVQDWS